MFRFCSLKDRSIAPFFSLVILTILFSVLPALAEENNSTVNRTALVSYENGTVSAEWTVDYTASPVEGFPPLCVTFTVQGPLGEYYWDFGDGTTSTSRNPVHCYEKQGSYWVTLKYFVGEIHGEVQKENFITVKDPMTFVDYKGDPSSGAAPLTVQFSVIGQPTNVVWDFDDGEISTEMNPRHQYTKEGFYTPVLKYCLDGACEKTSKFNYIEVSPAAEVNFTAERQEGTAPLATKFVVNGSADTFTWDFGDGTISYEQDPGHFYKDPGLYTVSLTYSVDGASYTVTKKDYIRVSSRYTPDINASPRTGIAPLCVEFDMKNQPLSWVWQFGDNTTSPDINPVHCYGMNGTYSPELQYCYNDLCDVVNKTDFITVDPPRILTEKGADEATVKFGTDSRDGIKYYWDFGDQMQSDKAMPVHVYEEPGTYNVSVSIQATCGCYATAFSRVTVSPKKPLDFSATPVTGCAPHCVQFTESSPEIPKSREWDFGDTEKSEEKNPFHCYQYPGVYTVTLKNVYPGSESNVTRSDLITVYSVPVSTFSFFPNSGYAPLSVVFTDTTRSLEERRYWTFGDGGSGTSDRMEHTFTDPGVYNVSLKVWSKGDCMNEVVQQVRVLKPDEVKYDLEGVPRRGIAPLCTQYKVLGNPPQWEVDLGDGEKSTEKGPFHCYQTAGIYTPKLHACNYDGCEDVVKPEYVVAIPDYYQNLTLYEGWNLVSVPVTLEPMKDSAGIFTGVDTAGHSLFSWNGAAGGWIRMTRDSPLDPLIGVWIYSAAKTDVQLPISQTGPEGNLSRPLARGWNLISFPGISPVPAESVFTRDLGWSYLIGFDGVTQKYWDPIQKGSQGAGQMIDPRAAYWIYMEEPGSLLVPAL
jgi:PKD repeat protein